MPPLFNPLPRSDMHDLFRQGARVSLGGIVLVYQRPEGKFSQVSIIVTPGADKRATKRNRIKRCMKEAVGACLQRAPMCFRGVFLIKQPMSTTTTSACEWMVSGLLEKLFNNKNQRR